MPSAARWLNWPPRKVPDVRISAQVEAELVELGDEETADYLEGLATEGGLQA